MATPRRDPAERAERALQPTETIVPAHGAGRLRRGNPGNRGGPGPMPSAIRRAARKALAPRLVLVRGIADGVVLEKHRIGDTEQFRWQSPKASDRLKAIALLAQIGLGPDTTLEDVRARLGATVDVLRQALGDQPALLAHVEQQLREVWR